MMGNVDLRETSQIMYHSKVLEENYPNVSLIKFEQFCQNYGHLTLSGSGGGGGGLSGLDDQIHSCHSETSYFMAPKLCDF